jgi:hypothetical protein
VFMFKLTDPFTGKILGFSQFAVQDKITQTTRAEDGTIAQESRTILCEETEDIPRQAVTAEQWLQSQGYSSMRLVTLLDLENQLSAVLGNSPKLTAVRTWINGILATFIQNPTPRADWPAAPFTFEETTQEAWLAL